MTDDRWSAAHLLLPGLRAGVRLQVARAQWSMSSSAWAGDATCGWGWDA